MPNSIDYNQEMDHEVVEVADKVLGIKIIISERLVHGEQNFVYKLSSENTSFIARIFREKWWPEDGKYPWIETILTEFQIPHAKTLFYDKSSNYFPFGFMITEFIEGVNGEEAIKNGLISFKDFHIKLFLLLDKIHTIPLEKFGLVKNGFGEFENYEKYKSSFLKETIKRARKIPNFDQSLLNSVEEKGRNIWKRVKYPPVLVHGDATPDNAILTNNNEIVLIDWDNARSEIWFDDYAWIVYCGSHISKEGSLEIRRQIFYDINEKLIESNDLIELEKVYNLTKAIGLLSYYYFIRKNMKHYELTLERLKQNLKIF